MPTPSEIRDNLREQLFDLRKLGGFDAHASITTRLCEQTLALADEMVRLEAAITLVAGQARNAPTHATPADIMHALEMYGHSKGDWSPDGAK